MEKISFHFNGGIADNHELNFYEAGRFQYAAARFIYALESFRQDRRVVGRLTSKIAVDIRVKAPTQGSFLQEIIIFAAPAITDCALQVSVEAMMAYAWNKLFPASDTDNELAVELARAEVAREGQRTLQEVERTQQIRLMSDVARNGEATTQQALTILQETLNSNRQVMLGEQEITKQVLQLAFGRTKSDIERQELLSEFQEPLAEIDDTESDKLAGQLRKAVPDMVLPLRTSAEQLDIGGVSTGKSFASLDFDSGQAIGSHQIDADRQTRRGKIKSYDREQGSGKFRYHGDNALLNPLSFKIPSERRLEVGPKIIQAMQMESVIVAIQFVKDKFGNTISVILWDVFPEEGEG